MNIVSKKLDYSAPQNVNDIYVFTGNSTVTRDPGKLVMGRGAAKEVRDTYPGIDKAFGSALREDGQDGGKYFLCVLFDGDVGIGAFQVKYHFTAKADVNLIEHSTRALTTYANEHPDQTIHMNFPGIGCGGLDRDTVLPIIEALPDNVIIYEA